MGNNINSCARSKFSVVHYANRIDNNDHEEPDLLD